MVHGELGLPALEIASLGGVCASGVDRAEERLPAGARRREAKRRRLRQRAAEPPLQGEPLRGVRPARASRCRSTPSSCAGCCPTAPARRCCSRRRPRGGVSLRVDWIDIRSYAHEHATCMYAGGVQAPGRLDGPGLARLPDVRRRRARGRAVPAPGRAPARRADPPAASTASSAWSTRAGWSRPSSTTSSATTRRSSSARASSSCSRKAGASLPEEKWFSNLTTRGNVGSASVFVLLEELRERAAASGPGQQIFVMVPESGRFVVSYMKLTAVGERRARPRPPAPAPRRRRPARRRCT